MGRSREAVMKRGRWLRADRLSSASDIDFPVELGERCILTVYLIDVAYEVWETPDTCFLRNANQANDVINSDDSRIESCACTTRYPIISELERRYYGGLLFRRGGAVQCCHAEGELNSGILSYASLLAICDCRETT
jgi:hypothetical protein